MDSKEDLLKPSNSPSIAPNTSGNRPIVRRLNKLPIYIVLGILTCFLIIILIVGATKGHKLNMAEENIKQNADASTLAQSVLNTAPQDAIIGNSSASSASAIPNESVLASDADLTNLDNLPLPLDNNAPTTLSVPPDVNSSIDMQQARAEQIRNDREQMFTQALRAKSQISNSSSLTNSLSSNRQAFLNENTDDINAQINQVQQAAQNATAENTQVEAKAVYDQLSNNNVSLSKPPLPSFTRKNLPESNKWDLNAKVENAKQNTLMTGSVIPAIAISGINSDLPGQVMAQVSINVYDSLTGRRILIPQGSKLIGSYDSGVALGQNRLFVAWNRIIFPNGRSIDIGSMPASNGAGYSGVKDRTNNHFIKIWSNALMLSAVGASMSFGTNRDKNDNNGNNTTFSSALASNLAATFGQAVAQSIQRNMNISPTLQIRPGYRFNVIVTKDIKF